MAKDPYRYFRIEAAELVDKLAKGLLELEKRADAELVATVLRLAHTLKGAARIVKHRELSELAHSLETALAPLTESPVPQHHEVALGLVDAMTAAVAALPGPEGAPAPVAKAAPAGPTPVMPLVRADTEGIDKLLAGLGVLGELVSSLRQDRNPRALLDQIERELRSVRQEAEQLRLEPIGSVFTTLERTARDAALATGKAIKFQASGGEHRVDATVLAGLHAALVQLVRNAAVHGIEELAKRAAAGKAPEGSIEVAVRSLGGRVELVCRDDGGGIDVEAVRRAATARGLRLPTDTAGLLELVLSGGLSTRTEITELAGRGIGIDLVRATLRDLDGTVTVATGSTGTTFTLVVPLTIASVPALVVAAGERTVAIPLAAILRVIQLKAATVSHGTSGSVLALDDMTMPFAPLTAMLGAPASTPQSVIVVNVEPEGLAAIAIDRLLGTEDLVVRPIPVGTPVDPIVWGIAADGAGVPRPVLEPSALVAAVKRAPDRPATEAARPLPIMVVDDSLTTRMLEQSILEAAGYEVELASSAEEALGKLPLRSYGLVLVDVEMPGMNGYELVRELRTRPEYAALPAILVTSLNSPQDRQRGADAGAHGYVVKGEFDQVQLVAMIRRLVRT